MRERILGVHDTLDVGLHIRLIAFQQIFKIFSAGEVIVAAIVGSARDHKGDF